MNHGREKTKIAILGTLPPLRALSSYCFELARAVSQLFSVEFISFKSIYPAFLYPGGNLEEDYTYPPLSSSNIRIRRHLAWYNPVKWFSEALTARGSLLHAQWWSLPLFPVYLVVCLGFKVRKRPVIFTVHNVLPHEHKSLYMACSSLLFAFGDHFIVHSVEGCKKLSSFYGIEKKRISIIPHGSLDFHVRNEKTSAELRSQLGLSLHDRVVVIFGAIRPYKGIDVAIRALASMDRELGVKLVIAGKLWEEWLPYERMIHEMCLEDRVVTILEYIPSCEVYKYFEAADLAIFPYRHFDAQSGAAATAVSFRKPLIVSDTGGLPELAPHPGCIVPPGDHAALAAAMTEFFRNPRFREEAIENMGVISRKLSWNHIAGQLSELYLKVLNQRTARG